MKKTAEISACGKYRYELTRVWDESKPMVCFIGLNPSTADAEKDDATIRKCIGFATRWGYGGLLMLNVFAFRTVSPKVLKAAAKNGDDVIGDNRGPKILNRIKNHAITHVVACWGQHAGQRGIDVASWWPEPLECLGRCRDGSPRHPLMLAYSTSLERYRQF